MATAEHREPCDSRGSCTVLGAPRGEIPPGDSTTAVFKRCLSHVRYHPNSGAKEDIAGGSSGARNGHRCRKISNLHDVTQMVLLSLEDCVFPSNCEKKLAMRAAEVSTLGSRKIADRFDPFGAGYLADPYPTFAVARDAAPAFYSTDLDHWVVTGYADVRYVLRTTAEFSTINALEPLSNLCPHAASILKEGGYAATPRYATRGPSGWHVRDSDQPGPALCICGLGMPLRW